MWGWSQAVREELAVVEKVAWVVTWIHRKRVVPYEGFLLWPWRWFVEIEGPTGELGEHANFHPVAVILGSIDRVISAAEW